MNPFDCLIKFTRDNNIKMSTIYENDKVTPTSAIFYKGKRIGIMGTAPVTIDGLADIVEFINDEELTIAYQRLLLELI
jgi:hypothetical protein